MDDNAFRGYEHGSRRGVVLTELCFVNIQMIPWLLCRLLTWFHASCPNIAI